MVSAEPLTIGLDQSKILIVRAISDWFNDFLNSLGLVKALNRLLGLLVDYWFEGSNRKIINRSYSYKDIYNKIFYYLEVSKVFELRGRL